MPRIFNKRVYLHPAAPRQFHSEADLRGWCQDNGQDPTFIMGFDSVSEYRRWKDLRRMEQAGTISDLRRQVPYELVPQQFEMEQTGTKKRKVYFINAHQFYRKYDAVRHAKDNGFKVSDIAVVEEEVPVLKKRIIENALVYTADFVYIDEDGNEVVEDVKSDYTRKEKDYVIRRKLMLFLKHIKIREIVV